MPAGPLAVMGAIACLACATVPPGTEPAPVTVAAAAEIRAVAFSTDGSTLYYAFGGARCTLKDVDVASGQPSTVRELSFCPDRLTALEDGSLLAASSSHSDWMDTEGRELFEGRTILAALDRDHFLEAAPRGLSWHAGGNAVTLEPVALRAPRVLTGGALVGVESVGDGERLVRFDGPAATPITPTFPAIDSWDASPRGDEVVFSAKVETGFDIGIVASSGGDVRWVAPDPGDERNVTWAPRGNKITYTLESVDATLVRSVHVPTSYQVIFGMQLTTVRHIAWEPRAERIAMVIESPVNGPRIDWAGYQGDGRASLVPAVEEVASPVEAVLWERGSGVLLGPDTVRYGETRPTVVWIDAGSSFAWRADVARLRRDGLAVLSVRSENVGDLAAALDELPWFDPARLYIVNVASASIASAPSLDRAVSFVRPDGEGVAHGTAEVIDDGDAQFRAIAARRILDREGKGR